MFSFQLLLSLVICCLLSISNYGKFFGYLLYLQDYESSVKITELFFYKNHTYMFVIPNSLKITESTMMTSF